MIDRSADRMSDDALPGLVEARLVGFYDFPRPGGAPCGSAGSASTQGLRRHHPHGPTRPPTRGASNGLARVAVPVPATAPPPTDSQARLDGRRLMCPPRGPTERLA